MDMAADESAAAATSDIFSSNAVESARDAFESAPAADAALDMTCRSPFEQRYLSAVSRRHQSFSCDSGIKASP